MSCTAVGFACPGCGHSGPHSITAYTWDEHHLTGLVLHCDRCEQVWTENVSGSP